MQKISLDFLNKTEYVTKISEYDRDMLVEFRRRLKQVQKKEEELRAEYEELSALQTTLSEKRASVETLLSNKNIQIANLESEIGENAKVLQQLIAEAQEAERRQKEAEAAQLAAQQQAMNNNAGQNNQIQAPSGGSSTGGSTSGGVMPPSSDNVVSGSGYFTHPCPGMTYQSSYFGEIREFEVGGHKGHDYAAPEGTPTYAAAAGTVLIANYSTSAGNWVVIQHDNGLVSKYIASFCTDSICWTESRERSADWICGKYRTVDRTTPSLSGRIKRCSSESFKLYVRRVIIWRINIVF